jgi:hypothetical protein
MNLTNLTAVLNPTASPHHSASLAETPGAASLPGTDAFLALAALAFTTIQQRSGADEFPFPGSLSLARTSPLICAGDIIVALATVIYGLSKRKSFRWSCALYVRNTRLHRTGRIPELEMYRLLVDAVVSIPAIYGAVTIFLAKGVDIRIIVWASLFTAAPIISALMRMSAESKIAQAEVDEFLIGAGAGKWLLNASDVIWCSAYACQFTLWIRVFEAFSRLPQFAKWMDLGIGISIVLAIFFSAMCKARFFRYWSLRNWEHDQTSVALTVGFVLALLVGMPTDPESIAKWRQGLFVPLGAFSVVVNMLFLVTVLEDVLYYLPMALREGTWKGILPRERTGPVPDELKGRINPLLSTAPEFWRRTLMINFACCQIFFAVLNFAVIEGSSVGTLPNSINNSSR